MKTIMFALMSVVLCTIAFVTACSEKKIPSEVVKQIPAKYDINDPIFSDAKSRLQEAIDLCGVGVVKGAEGANRCAYQVELDSEFFQDMRLKTGLRHNDDWAYKKGVEFVDPVVTEQLPDNYDLRDFMKAGQPLIKQQQCGDCWAWATHHGYEIVQAVHDQKVVDDSVQTVLSCSGEGSCGGGFMSAVDFLKGGLPLESEFPYKNGVTGTCKFSKAELSKGWDPKVIDTPYVGSSRDYSRSMQASDGSFRSRPTVEQMKAAIYKWKAPLVVTVDAYSISGSGVYDSCSAINSGGNHMVVIVGWEKWNGKDVAHVWNSWGQGHGDHGVSRIVWECGAGKLNRGLGVEAKVVQYKPACQPPKPDLGEPKAIILQGSAVKLGKPMKDTVCKWEPADGLSDPNACETYASPGGSTEYHLTAKNDCATASAMKLVEVWGPKGRSLQVLTPNGPAKAN